MNNSVIEALEKIGESNIEPYIQAIINLASEKPSVSYWGPHYDLIREQNLDWVASMGGLALEQLNQAQSSPKEYVRKFAQDALLRIQLRNIRMNIRL